MGSLRLYSLAIAFFHVRNAFQRQSCCWASVVCSLSLLSVSRYMYVLTLIPILVDGHLSCLQFLAIMMKSLHVGLCLDIRLHFPWANA